MKVSQFLVIALLTAANLILFTTLGLLWLNREPESEPAVAYQAIPAEPTPSATTPPHPTVTAAGVPLTKTATALPPTPTVVALPTNTPTLRIEPVPGGWASPFPTPTLWRIVRPIVAPTLRPPTATSLPPPTRLATATVNRATLAGISRSNPLQPGSSFYTLEPGSSLWFKLGSGGEQIVVSIESYPITGVTMQVFAPDAPDHPIGLATPQGERLVWAGGQWSSVGDWLGRVTNLNATSVSFKLSRRVQEMSVPTCQSYWEYIGKDLVYWTACH